MDPIPSKAHLEESQTSIPSIKNPWQEIDDEFTQKRNELFAFRKSKNKQCEVPTNPVVQYLDTEVFNLLLPILEKTILKAVATNTIKHQKSTFNGIDFISEMLWNLNPRHSYRQSQWTYIFDVDWVLDHLQYNPRPYFPFSWIWSEEYGATKIQAYMRGYWVRIRPEVQELRQFWKDYYANPSPNKILTSTNCDIKVLYIK